MHLNLDIPTIIFILGTTHLMQVLVFFHQYRVNKTYPGVGWWLLWSAAEVVGFLAILLRDIPALFPLVIILQNSMIVAGTIFLYIGVNLFLGRKVNLKLIIPVLTLFLAGLLYFLFVDNNIRIRSVVVNVTLATIPFFIAYSLFVNKRKAIRASANFNGVVFMLHGLIFTFRTGMIIAGVQIEHFLTPTLFNFIPFFDALVVSLLWTFGLIIMLNQQLNSDVSEAKEQLQQIFNTSPDAASITRLEDGLMVDINESYSAITGYSREEMIGNSSVTINIWKDISDWNQVVSLIQKQGHCENYEATFILKGGREIIGLMSAKQIDLQGVPHIISITKDITERKRIERNIQEKNQQLQSVNAEKDKFLSILAHDMRNPFNAFLGLTQLLAEDLADMEFEEIQKIAVSLNKSAVNLYRLLDNLLEWSYIQHGKLSMHPVLISLQEKIYQIAEVVADYAPKKGIRIEYAIPADATVFADVHMFDAIIRNLVFNAVKFTPAGGRITISAKSLENKMTEISVKDTGIGIPPDFLGKLFTLDQSTSRKGTTGEPSTGLGLIICKEFVERHEGRIWVESEEGKGSVFSFTLPCSQ